MSYVGTHIVHEFSGYIKIKIQESVAWIATQYYVAPLNAIYYNSELYSLCAERHRMASEPATIFGCLNRCLPNPKCFYD